MNLQEPKIEIKPTDGSAVRSHESFSPHVHAICHHSGRYLTKDETNPKSFQFPHEQHDFPGFNELDREFAKAAHTSEYQHISWSQAGISGIFCIVSSLLILWGVVILWSHRLQVASSQEEILFNILSWGGGVLGILLLVWGGFMIGRKEKIYHKKARKRREQPFTHAFPLLHCRYDIMATEQLRINFDNTSDNAPEVNGELCTLKVWVYPSQQSPNLKTYEELYPKQQNGTVMAGILAMSNVGNIRFRTHSDIEFDHRLVLSDSMQSIQRSWKSNEERWDLNTPAIKKEFTYEIDSPRRFEIGQFDGKRVSNPPLKCFIYLATSYRIEIHFQWNDQVDAHCHMKECKLTVPEPLKATVEQMSSGWYDTQHQVTFWQDAGRYDVDNRRIIWQEIPFQDIYHPSGSADGYVQSNGRAQHDQLASKQLLLSVVFSKPVLEQLPILTGEYECILSDLVSGLLLKANSIWDARGIRITESDPTLPPVFRKSSRIHGTFSFETERLLQEHEHVRSTRIQCKNDADHDLLEQVLDTLARWDINLQHIEEAAPRFEISGKSLAQLSYWDIMGRRYDPGTLESFDIHLVITGDYQAKQEGNNKLSTIGETNISNNMYIPDTNIELTVRCLHDPRDHDTRERANTLLDALEQNLRQRESWYKEDQTRPGKNTVTFDDCLQVRLNLSPDATEWQIDAININPTKILRKVEVTLKTPPYIASTSSYFVFEDIQPDKSSEKPLQLHIVSNNQIREIEEEIRDNKKAIKESERAIEELEKKQQHESSPVDEKKLASEIGRQEQNLNDHRDKLNQLQQQQVVPVIIDVHVAYLVDNDHLLKHKVGKLQIHILQANL